jgi:hypothetical protein
MGALDWQFLSISMWMANAVCMTTIFFFKPQQTIYTIWIALCLFMSTQVRLACDDRTRFHILRCHSALPDSCAYARQMVSGLTRILLGAGPWKKVMRAEGTT